MNHLPEILRIIAQALTQIAGLLTAQSSEPEDNQSSLVQYTPSTTLKPEQDLEQGIYDKGPCRYCTRSRVDQDIPLCYFHLDKRTKKTLYPDL